MQPANMQKHAQKRLRRLRASEQTNTAATLSFLWSKAKLEQSWL
jgi:hypothetical protein